MESLGILNLTWQEKVANLVKKWFAGTSDAKLINSKIIDNVHRSYVSYLATGYKAINFSKTNQDIVLSTMDKESIGLVREVARESKTSFIMSDRILRAIYYLASIGQIPYEKYDPAGYDTQTKLTKKFSTEKSFLEKIIPSKKPLIIGGIIIAGLAGAYFFTKGQKYTYYLKKFKGKGGK